MPARGFIANRAEEAREALAAWERVGRDPASDDLEISWVRTTLAAGAAELKLRMLAEANA